MSTLLRLEAITKCYDPSGPPAVDQVSLEVQPGEIFALLGPSGCGKTTTLRIIAGLERPDQGQVYLAQQLVCGPRRHLPPEARGIGFVFQDYALFPHLNVLQNVQFGLRRGSRQQRRQQALEVLRLVGLSGMEDRGPQQLSGGEQQRVALARALAPRPHLILFDEPFGSLDAGLRETTRREVRTLLHQQKLTAVFVTHDQDEALTFADRLAVMRAGRVEQVGTPQTVYRRPRTPFVAQFLGGANLLQVQARGDWAQAPFGRVELDRPVQGSVMVSLRPEDLQIRTPDRQAPCGTITEREFGGDRVTYRVQWEGQTLLVQTGLRCWWEVGQPVCLAVLDKAVVLEIQPE